MTNSYKKFILIYLESKSLNSDSIRFNKDDITLRIIEHQHMMPDFLRIGIFFLSFLFRVYCFFIKVFIRKEVINYVEIGRKSYFPPFNKLIRFHDSVFELILGNQPLTEISEISTHIDDSIVYDFVVIGSGPGGSISSYKLKENGYNVCLIESGHDIDDNMIKPFSYSEMIYQYAHGGLTATLGNANIAYVEGKTLGGGSQVNSGLYHRTPNEVLKHWGNKYNLKNSNLDSLEKYFSIIEEDLCVSYFPEGAIPKSSLKLAEGAKKLNWGFQEVPRWYNYKAFSKGTKMTMKKTYLKRFKDLGGKILKLTKAEKLIKLNNLWSVEVKQKNRRGNIKAKNIILSAGTIGTAKILKKSKLSSLAGKNFQMHPTIKVVALFKEKINFQDMGVPVHQVKEFSPDISFGCSISSKSYLRVALLDHPHFLKYVDKKWENMAIYYCMIKPKGFGKIMRLPFFDDSIVSYHLHDSDKLNLALGLKNLCRLLLKAGAVNLFPSINGAHPVSKSQDIELLPNKINPSQTSLMTVHLFSSCPIGENRKYCVANSYGKIFGQDGLFIADSSMLPTAPGVNPQGTIMALAMRNIDKIMEDL